MAPKPGGPAVDSLIAALTDEKFTEALTKIIQPIIQLSVDNAIGKLRDELKQRDLQIDHLTKENHELRATVQHQAEYLDQVETYTKQENLIIQGIPSSSFAEATASNLQSESTDALPRHENSTVTEAIFLDMCHKFDIKVQSSDISICHRLRKSHQQQHPPIIVRFTNRKARAEVLAARKKLRSEPGNAIYVNEHLTKATNKLFFAARQMLKNRRIAGVWTNYGHVVVKTINSVTVNIKTQSDLDQL